DCSLSNNPSKTGNQTFCCSGCKVDSENGCPSYLSFNWWSQSCRGKTMPSLSDETCLPMARPTNGQTQFCCGDQNVRDGDCETDPTLDCSSGGAVLCGGNNQFVRGINCSSVAVKAHGGYAVCCGGTSDCQEVPSDPDLGVSLYICGAPVPPSKKDPSLACTIG